LRYCSSKTEEMLSALSSIKNLEDGVSKMPVLSGLNPT
jgi:hypothetical protein